MNKKAIVIGSGFAGLAAASCLAHEGVQTLVLEKNSDIGGRARKFKQAGFTFDMGPSWYWMPDVFERFFSRFGKSAADYYSLKKLSPSYSIVFSKEEKISIPSELHQLFDLFESLERGSSRKLHYFLKEAEYKYQVGVNDLVYKPCNSPTEYLDRRLLSGIFRLQVFQSFHNHARKFFRDPRILSLLEFPVLFLGALPQNTPALYSLMNYAGLSLGTWYPMGGMFKIIDAMRELAESLGVEFRTDEEVEKISIENSFARSLRTKNFLHRADGVIAAADYHHVEQNLLEEKFRRYDRKYWSSRVMAPSSLIFYLGVKKKLKNLDHHNLFFDEDFALHAKEIYDTPQWPTKPLFYVCCPSVTDDSVAPDGMENLFILMPLAPGIADTEKLREQYYGLIMDRLESLTNQKIREHVIVKKSYAIKDFHRDYNAYRGNAYGLANTLMQTAFFKPKISSKKVKNLFFAGQLTVPGPGVPPSLISGQIAANELIKHFRGN